MRSGRYISGAYGTRQRRREGKKWASLSAGVLRILGSFGTPLHRAREADERDVPEGHPKKRSLCTTFSYLISSFSTVQKVLCSIWAPSRDLHRITG